MKLVARIALVATIAGALAGVPPVALGQEGNTGHDTAAVAVNTRDGNSIFRFSFQIVRVTGDTVDATNAAVAFASCEGCQTVAASFQAVLVFSDPSVVVPENYAIAINVECTSCETLASAYQYVLTTGGVVRFTPEGNQELAAIRADLAQLAADADELDIFEIQAELDALAARLEAVLLNELVLAGVPVTVEAVDADSGVEPAETATPTPGPTGSPTDVATETPTESPSPEESLSPTPEETISPTTTESPEVEATP